MFERLRRHPFAVEAFFRRSLVLTYALPAPSLVGLLGPGLELDTYEGFGFLAIALVQTQNLRPKNAPEFLGRDFFLSGYRIFTRFVRPGRAPLRGLKILRSDTDRRAMEFFGNLFTRYGYQHARVEQRITATTYSVSVETHTHDADLEVEADISKPADHVPVGSPFRSLDDARRFAGPLPFTFGFDAKQNQMVVVKGVRSTWTPTPVEVRVKRASFLEQAPFAEARPVLANAFYVENVPYWWMPGKLEALP